MVGLDGHITRAKFRSPNGAALIQSLYWAWPWCMGADKSLALPRRKQARKHVRDVRDFKNLETRAVIKFIFSLQGKAPKEIHAILTETLACFLPGRAKDLSAPLLKTVNFKRTGTNTLQNLLP